MNTIEAPQGASEMAEKYMFDEHETTLRVGDINQPTPLSSIDRNLIAEMKETDNRIVKTLAAVSAVGFSASTVALYLSNKNENAIFSTLSLLTFMVGIGYGLGSYIYNSTVMDHYNDKKSK